MKPKRVAGEDLAVSPEAADDTTVRSQEPRSCCPTCGQPLRTLRQAGEPRRATRSIEELCDAVIEVLSPKGTMMTSKEIAAALGYPPRPHLPQIVRQVVMSLYWGEVLAVEARWQYRWTGRTRVSLRSATAAHSSPKVRAWRWRGASRRAT